jgi:spermidine/putrescine transport system permease protein
VKFNTLFKRLYLYLILFFLYMPIFTLIIYSFNDNRTRGSWGGFSLRWYIQLFADPRVMQALYVTVGIAVIAAIVATVLGTIAAIGIHSADKLPRSLLINVSYLPMLTPEIVTGVSLMILFLAAKVQLGFFTMLLAHITFDLPYVIFAVLPKLRQMNKHSYEAALDLGAKPRTALFKVVLPEIAPGMFTGFLLSFTLSLDDFVISYFTGGNVQNLSVMIYSMARRGINPTINALSTIMFTFIILLLLIVNKRASLADR